MLLRIVAIWYMLLRMLLLLGTLRRQQQGPWQPRVSIIVAARNAADTLPPLLTSILNQTYPDYQVIVVDDRSTDGMAQLLEAWQMQNKHLLIVRVSAETIHASPKIHALAQGVAIADGEVLLFTDADCLVPITWIEGMVAAFGPDIGAVLGYVDLYAPKGKLLEKLQMFDYFAMMVMLQGATRLGQPLGATGANLAYRRVAYDEVDGLRGLSPNAVADDMALIQRIIDQTGWRIAFCDDRRAHVRSAAEPTAKRLIDQRTRWIKGGQDVFWRNWSLMIISTSLGLFNGILTSFPLLLHRRDLRQALKQAVVLRVCVDLLHFAVAATRFGRIELLPYFPLWLLVHIPTTMLQPLLSIRRSYAWKEASDAS
jgi:cellulose synthase/poly-beta-1,6-N-acetylglucosamine synthase-like glycosyltransferase